ncbi:MAG: periplasmic heavy metal sensor [Terriglobia bacterium]
MKRWTSLLVFTLSLGTLLAQDPSAPSGPPWGPPSFDALKTFLQLTDKQVQDLTALQTSFRDAVKPIHEQIRTKEKDLHTEMGKGSPDSALVAQLLVDIKGLRSQIKSKRDELRPQLLALLSDSQKNSLATLQQALTLQQTAHQAARLDLIDGPQTGSGPGPGFGGMRKGMLRHGFDQP